MFNKYIIQDNSRGILEASARMASEMRQDRESREKIAEKEIKARDRVDITLEEYENMKQKIKKLENENHYFKVLFDRIEIPWDKKIIPDSVRVYQDDDPMNFTRQYKILFDIDRDELRKF
jgi:hypothetical protein